MRCKACNEEYQLVTDSVGKHEELCRSCLYSVQNPTRLDEPDVGYIHEELVEKSLFPDLE